MGRILWKAAGFEEAGWLGRCKGTQERQWPELG